MPSFAPTPLAVSLVLTGLLQIALAVAYGLAPAATFAAMGHSPIAPDHAYALAMLASRFLVMGVTMILAARRPGLFRPLILAMVAIQVVDLLAGLWFTGTGGVPLSLSAVPMIDAAVIAAALWVWRPRATGEA